MGTTIQNASPASPLPVLPSIVTHTTPLDVSPLGHSISPAAKNVASLPQGHGHLPPVQCSLDPNFGISRNDLCHLTIRLRDGLPLPHYLMSPSGQPVTFPPMSDSAKIPARPMLETRTFKPSTWADPNISLEGGMLSPRELHSPKPNSLTPFVCKKTL